ncbi:MAG: glycosyltransferase family 4 protein [Bacteroidales bacterium]|jgi:glycosyltransferase involved in cell wall biosynthesis|nr:glycosyltransferase family 4 protein [Bacteroidales bacterium]
MKILFVTNYSGGGAEGALIEMIEACYSLNHQLYGVFNHGGFLIESCKKFLSNYSFLKQPNWVMSNPNLNIKGKIVLLFGMSISIIKMIFFILRYNPKVVISNGPLCYAAAFASKILRKKHVWVLHEVLKEGLGVDYIFGIDLSMNCINKLSQIIVCNSQVVKNYYEQFIPSKKLIVAYYSVECENIGEINHNFNNTNCLNIIFVGRFFDFKNQFDAVKAVLLLKNINEKIHLTLVGANNSEYSNQITQFVYDNKLNDNISIVNESKDIFPFFQQADCSLVCSRFEAFGRVTIEAMKCGLPVIASNIGANSELIKDGFNGYLYKFDNPNDLADKILMMKDANNRNYMAKNAYEWAINTFTMENYSKSWEEILNNITSKNKK